MAQIISNSFFDKEFEIKEKIRLKKIEQELNEKQEKYEREEMEKLKEKDKHIEKSMESIPQNENGDLKKELNETESDVKSPKQKSLLKKLGMDEEYNNLNKNMEIINNKKIKKAKDSNQSKEVKRETVKTPKKKIKNAKDNKTIFSYGFINKDHQKIYSPNCTKKEDADAKTTYECILESNN